MKIYIASVNLGDKPIPRILPHRLLSFYEIINKVFGADTVFYFIQKYNIKNK